MLLHHLTSGEAQEAEAELQSQGVGQIPADKRPWLLPGEGNPATGAGADSSAQPAAASNAPRQLWEGEDDGDDVADTASSVAAVRQLEAAQARRHNAANQVLPARETTVAAADSAAAATAAGAAAALLFTATGQDVGGMAANTAAAASSVSSSSNTREAACVTEVQQQQFSESSDSTYSVEQAHSAAADARSTSSLTSPHTPAPDSYSRASLGSRHTSGSNRSRYDSSSSVQYAQQVSVRHNRSLRLTEQGTFAFAGPADAATSSADSAGAAPDGNAAAAADQQLLQQALSAGQAAGSSSSSSVLSSILQQDQRQPQHSSPLPSPPNFVRVLLRPDSDELGLTARASSATVSPAPQDAVQTSAVASDASSSASRRGSSTVGSATGSPSVTVTRSTELLKEVHQSVTETTRISVLDHSSSSSSRLFNAAGSSRNIHSSSTGRSSDPAHAQRPGAAGELFLFGYLSRRLPGFTEANWHSSNRVYLPGPQELQLPSREPPYDFLYEDTTGALTSEPGTLCFIECKATSGDARISPIPIPITPNEWDLAQQVHRKRLDGAEPRCQYILFRVDRVGRNGSTSEPRLAAMLHDPVQLLADGQLSITGEDLCIIRYRPDILTQTR